MSTTVESRMRTALEHEPAVNLHSDRIDVEYENGVDKVVSRIDVELA